MHRAGEAIKQYADKHRREVQFQEGDYVLLSTRHLRFKTSPTKLQRKFVGPFKILEKISRVAYRLELPPRWRIDPVFHSSLLKLWHESHWSCPADVPAPEIEVEEEPHYLVERILRWRRVKRGRRSIWEFLVTWTGYPMDEAEWIPGSYFSDPAGLEEQIAQNRPVEDVGARSG